MVGDKLPLRWHTILVCLLPLISLTVTAPSTVIDDSDSTVGLKLTAGKTYLYNFETTTVTELAGTSEDTTSIKLQGQVQVSLLTGSTNEFGLKVSKASGESAGAKVSDSSLAPLLSDSVRFTYVNGAVKEFYVSESDPVWSANVKRSLVSLFVNYAIKSDKQKGYYLENDISGSNCPTEYEVTDATFKKERDLNDCYKRDGGWSVHYGIPIHSDPNDHHSDPTISSKQACTLTYENGVLKSALCTETHKVTLLSSSNGKSGAKASVTSKLDYISTQAGTVPSGATQLSSIFFDHAKTHPDESADIINAGAQLCNEIQAGRLTTETSSVVLSLRHKMSHAGEDQLHNAYVKLLEVCREPKAHQLFIDAASMAGTTDSISFVVGLIKDGKLNQKSQRLFRFYAIFADKPGVKALLEVTSLLRDLNDSRYLLTASGMARQFCNANSNCLENSAYKALVNTISSKTTDCLAPVPSKDSIVALQALGNLEKQTDESIQAITSCLKGTSHVVINALQAFRRDSCVEALLTESKNIFANTKNTADVRIHAYLALTRCYCKEMSKFVMGVLQNEESLQVISFVQSHRENYWDDHNDQFRDTENIPDPSVPITDPRKFSKNYESDYTFGELNLVKETNIIYSKESFLPRTISSNISAQMYGHQFNLFEYGINLANAEDLFESMFRNDGNFKFGPSRGRREAAPSVNKNDIQRIQSTLQKPEPKIESSDVYLRLLGTTIYAGTFDINDVTNPDTSDFGEAVQEALQGKEVDFTTPIPFLGDELMVPTISGLPLRIQSEGVAILSLKYSHKLKENFKEFSPHLVPSVSITNQMRLMIAEGFAPIGFEAETKIGASTDINAQGLLETDGKAYSYSVRLSLPRDQAELVTISNQLWWIDGENKRPMKTGVTEADKCCKEFLGLKLCSSVDIPPFFGKSVPMFPINGNGKVSLSMEKLDSKLTEILVKGVYANDNGERSVQIMFDTPNSEQNNHYELNGKVLPSPAKASFSLNSPQLNTEINYFTSNDGSLRTDSVNFKLGSQVYAFKVDSKFVNTKETLDIVLREELTIPGKQPFEFINLKYLKSSGFEGGKELTKRSAVGELVVNDIFLFYNSGNGITKNVLKLSGSSDARLSSGKIQNLKITDVKLFFMEEEYLTVNGESKKDSANKLILDLNAKVNTGKGKEDATIYGELEQSKEGTIGITKFTGKVSSTMASFINSDITFERKADLTSYFKYRTFNLNIVRKDGGGTFDLESTIDNRSGNLKLNQNFHVTCKQRNIDRKFGLSLNNEPNALEFNTDYSSASGVSVNLDSKIQFDSIIYNINGLVKMPSANVQFSTERKKNGDGTTYEHSINVENGFSAKVKTDVYSKNEGGKTWRFRDTAISSNKFAKDFTFNLKYDSDGSNKTASIFRRGGTIDVAASFPNSGDKVTMVVTRNSSPFSINIQSEVANSKKIDFNLESSEDRLIDIKGTVEDIAKSNKYTLGAKVQTNALGRSAGAEKYLNVYFDLGLGVKGNFKVESENKVAPVQSDISFHSSTKLNFGEPIELTIDVVTGPALSREHSFNVAYTSPRRSIKGGLVSLLEFDEDTKLIKVTITSPDLSGKCELGFRKFNPQEMQFEFVNIFTFDKAGEKFSDSSFVVEVSGGNGTPRVVSILLSGGSSAMKIQPFSGSFKAEYGSGKLGVNVVGGPDNQDKKMIKLILEKSKDASQKKYSIQAAKDFSYFEGELPELEIDVAFGYHYTSLSDFNFEESTKIISADDSGERTIIEGSRGLTVTSNSVKYTSVLSSKEGSKPEQKIQNINVEGALQSSKDFYCSIDFHHFLLGKILKDPSKTDFKLNVKLDQGSKFTFRFNFPNGLYELVELNVNKGKEGQLKTIAVEGKLDDKSLSVTSKSEYSPTKKFLDIGVVINNEPIKRLVIDYNNVNSNPSVTATVEYNGQTISSTGKLENSATGFTANFDLNGKWTLEVSRGETPGSKSLSLLAQDPTTSQKIDIKYSKEKSPQGFNIKGDASIKLDILKRFITKINVANGVDGGFDLNVVSGQQLDLNTNLALDNQNWKGRIFGSKSPSKKEMIINVCPASGSGPYCTKLQVYAEDAGDDKKFAGQAVFGSLEGNIMVIASKDEKKAELTYTKNGTPATFSIRTYKQYGTTQELDLTKDDVNGNGKSKKRGIELSLPDRTLAAVITKVEYDDADAKTVEVNLWFDAKNQPEKKLALGFSTIDANVQEEGQGRDVVLAFRHPVLPKALKVKSHYRYGITSKVFEMTTELDIFNSEENKVILSAELTHDVDTNSFQIDSTLKSDGQGFSLNTHCSKIVIDHPELEVNCEGTAKSPGRPDRKETLYVKSSDKDYVLRATNNEYVLSYKQHVDMSSEYRSDPFDDSEVQLPAAEISVELQLPGVDTPRVFKLNAIPAPFGYSIVSKVGSEEDKERAELWFGRISPVDCGFGLNYYNNENAKSELFDVTFTKHHKQMFVDLDWDKNAIKAFTNRKLQIQEERYSKIVDALMKDIDDAEAHVKSICNTISNSAVDFTPLLDWYEKNINEISDKYKVPPNRISLKGFNSKSKLDVASAVYEPFKKAYALIFNSIKQLYKTGFESLNNRLEEISTLPPKPDSSSTSSYVSAISQGAQNAAKKIREFVAKVKPLKEKYEMLNKAGRKLRELIVGQVKSTYKVTKNDLEGLLPYGDVHTFLENFQDYLSTALLEPTEITPENKLEIINQFEAAVTEILSKSYEINFQKGEILLRVPLVTEASSIKNLLKKPRHRSRTGGECLRDMSFLPPVGATGFVHGASNIRTFDGKEIQVGATACQYLLATDVSNNNFSVAIKFGPAEEKQVFIVDRRVTFVLTKGKVYYDGKSRNWLTLKKEDKVKGFELKYDGDYLIVSGPNGVKVGCSTNMEICAVQLNGYYHGKVNGLLGNLNNEAYDDGNDDKQALAESWKLNGNCAERFEDSSFPFYANLDYDYFFTSSRYSPHRIYKK